ncbi:hypothetical protein COCON_G00135690 [Conger conger]|uniref:Protein kinase domain-containing protein n=1 Tax=Conger conger TaxID=82655 RepID=A0A9Q1DEQ5_CONCO|nr:hypothetical protein COCON_G00135690 [Conger conger]
MTASAKQLDALCHLTAQALPSLQTKNHFKIIKLLGEGSYGKVMLAVHKKRGTPMALKFFPRGSTSLISFLREYNLSLAFCSHPSLTRALGIVYSTPLHYVFAQQAGLYGDLYDIIDPEVGMAEEMVQRVASQVSGALSHLHALGFVHRDVKPENIFLCDQTCQWVKLGDFGMVKPKGARVPAVWYDSPYCVPEVEMARGRKEQKASNGKNSKGKGAKGIGAVIPGTSTKAGSKEEKKKTIWVSVEDTENTKTGWTEKENKKRRGRKSSGKGRIWGGLGGVMKLEVQNAVLRPPSLKSLPHWPGASFKGCSAHSPAFGPCLRMS